MLPDGPTAEDTSSASTLHVKWYLGECLLHEGITDRDTVDSKMRVVVLSSIIICSGTAFKSVTRL